MNRYPNPRASIENLWSRATPVEPLLDAYRDQVLTEEADRQARLAAVAREALVTIDDLIRDHDDPGTAALGARYLLAQELIHHPAPGAPAIDPAAVLAELRTKHFTEAAELLQQADCAANETDGMDHAADLLAIAADAARAQQEQGADR